VVVVGPHVVDGLEPIARIVACVDGSTASEWALPAAAAWAATLRVGMSIVTVAEPVPEPIMSGAATRRRHGPPHAPEGYLRALAAAWVGRGVEVTTAAVYDPVSVAAGLADHLADGPAAMVVVATHGRTGLPRLAHGSVAATIVHQVAAPVLLVPERR
jgi:nucleotide-binding universal stress UspA family protein